jgi:hypothetical protein
MVEESQRKDKRKTAKRILKLAKKHPEWYTKEDIKYAKLVRKIYKKNATGETNISDSQSGGDDGVRGESQQPEQSGQPKRGWLAKVLHKAWSLVGF